MPDIKATVRVLHLEDSALDAQLIRSKLESEGLVCIITLVDTRQAFENALACQSFDLIICDFNLPSYDGHTAVKLVREKNLLTPLILISGSVKADDAVRALQFGATDYILKHNLDRLPSAVSRALEEFDRHENIASLPTNFVLSKNASRPSCSGWRKALSFRIWTARF